MRQILEYGGEVKEDLILQDSALLANQLPDIESAVQDIVKSSTLPDRFRVTEVLEGLAKKIRVKIQPATVVHILDDLAEDGLLQDIGWGWQKPDDAILKKTGKPVGGIDLNPTNYQLQIKRDGKGVPLPLNLQNVEQINVDGLVPVIINISPAPSMPLILGETSQQRTPELSQLR